MSALGSSRPPYSSNLESLTYSSPAEPDISGWRRTLPVFTSLSVSLPISPLSCPLIYQCPHLCHLSRILLSFHLHLSGHPFSCPFSFCPPVCPPIHSHVWASSVRVAVYPPISSQSNLRSFLHLFCLIILTYSICLHRLLCPPGVLYPSAIMLLFFPSIFPCAVTHSSIP